MHRQPAHRTCVSVDCDVGLYVVTCLCACVLVERVSILTCEHVSLPAEARTLYAFPARNSGVRVNLRAYRLTATRFSRDTTCRQHDVRTKRYSRRPKTSQDLTTFSLPLSPFFPPPALAVSLCAGWPAYDIAWYGAISLFAMRVIPMPIGRDPDDIPCSRRFAPRREATVFSETSMKDAGVVQLLKHDEEIAAHRAVTKLRVPMGSATRRARELTTAATTLNAERRGGQAKRERVQ